MYNCEIFKNKPNLGQLAFDGQWENAIEFMPGRFCSLDEVKQYLGDRKEVAFEAFFEDAFFGIRHVGSSEMLANQILKYASSILSAANGEEFFNIISESNSFKLAKNFKLAEIGAVNAWKSVAAIAISDPIESLSTLEDTFNQINETEVGQNNTHSKAIEFAFDNADGTSHWFAFPISMKMAPYSLQIEKLKFAFESYASWVNK